MRILLLVLAISCCPAASVAQPAGPDAATEIPYKKDAGPGNVSVFRVVGVMVLLLGLAGGSLLLVKRSALAGKLGIAEAKFIKLIELRRLSPRLSVYLIAVHGRQYLLTQSGDHLSIIEHPEPVDSHNV